MMSPTAEDTRVGKRNVLILLIVLALFDVAAVVLYFTTDEFRPFARVAGEARTETEQDAETERTARTGEPAADGPAAGDDQPEESMTAADEEDVARDAAGDEARPNDAGGRAPERISAGEIAQASPIPREERTLRRTHTVTEGENFYDLAGRYWQNEHLWPDLYVLNRSAFRDPDMIGQGSTIEVYERLGSPGSFTASELATLLDAYVESYQRYRQVGEEALEEGQSAGNRWLIQLGRIKINKAHWLLYSGMRFSHDMLDLYGDRIQDRDERVVRMYVERFGYADP